MLNDRKGVNLPNTELPLSPLTEKDRNDLDFGLRSASTGLRSSFVQRPTDVIEAQGIIKERAGIIAKIEKPAALECIDDDVAPFASNVDLTHCRRPNARASRLRCIYKVQTAACLLGECRRHRTVLRHHGLEFGRSLGPVDVEHRETGSSRECDVGVGPAGPVPADG